MKKLLLITFIITLSINLFAQTKISKTDKAKQYISQKGEVYFTFKINNKTELIALSKKLNIDKFNPETNIVTANANKTEFNYFLSLNKDFDLPKKLNVIPYRKMYDRSQKSTYAWDAYPTYSEYIQMMQDFETNYPSLCKVYNLGQTVQGRNIMIAKISDNVNTKEAEPRFLYLSTMHGDETTGYVLMLRLINYFLTNYGTNPEITDLLNTTEIWISPLENPDGTYHGGDNTVSGAIRRNANNVDLNRNYPDPDNGLHPDGNVWQPENLIYMGLVDSLHFVLSANLHGGSEVVNYPWDTYSGLPADNNFWIHVSREFADTVHIYGPSGYFDDLNNGITNGYAWYSISGGRQDYMNFYKNCKEFTLELSSTKTPPAADLPNYWNYLYRSFINYIKQVHYGINGIVTDSITGQGLKAGVIIESHEKLHSWTYSELPYGDYYRPVATGTYDVTFYATGYKPKTITNVSVSNNNTTTLNVQLYPLSEDTAITQNSTLCGAGVDTLTAIGDSIVWYNSPSAINPISTGSTFITPYLTNDTTYYVENIVKPDAMYVGSTNWSSNGSFDNSQYGLVFNCTKQVNLISFTINATATGNIVVGLLDSINNILQTDTIQVTQTGVSTVKTNLVIPVGMQLTLKLLSSDMDLYRNNSNTTFPYELNDVISILKTTASSQYSYYYYFYNWKVQEDYVKSQRTPVYININTYTAIADFSYNTDTTGLVTFTNTSNFADSYYWDFGDGTTSTDTNPTHNYANSGYYTVTLIAYNQCNSDTISYNINVIATSLNNNYKNDIIIYPNPTKDYINIKLSNNINNVNITITDLLGKNIYTQKTNKSRLITIPVNKLKKGIYLINVKNNKINKTTKLIVN